MTKEVNTPSAEHIYTQKTDPTRKISEDSVSDQDIIRILEDSSAEEEYFETIQSMQCPDSATLGSQVLTPLQDLADEVGDLGLESLAQELKEIVHRWWFLDHVQVQNHELVLSTTQLRTSLPLSRIYT